MSTDLISASLSTKTRSELRACWEGWAEIAGPAIDRPKAAVYLRSARGWSGSLEWQLRTVLMSLAHAGFDVPWSLVAAEIAAGFRSERACLRKIVELARSGEYQMLGISDLSRLGRDLHDVRGTLDDLLGAGVDVTWRGTPSLRDDRLARATITGAANLFAIARLREWDR